MKTLDGRSKWRNVDNVRLVGRVFTFFYLYRILSSLCSSDIAGIQLVIHGVETLKKYVRILGHLLQVT